MSINLFLFFVLIASVALLVRSLKYSQRTSSRIKIPTPSVHNPKWLVSSAKSTALKQSTGTVDPLIGEDIVINAPVDNVRKIVMKFGGSSLATADRVTYVAKLIKKHIEQGYKPIIVCSAMGKTTNSLLSAGDFALTGEVYIESLRTMHLTTAQTLGLTETTMTSLKDLLNECERLLEGVKYIGELSPRTKDALVSFGERLSVRIVSGTLNLMGVPAQAFDAWSLGMRTSSEFGNAEVKDESYANIRSTLAKFDWTIVPIVTGFIGHDEKGRITTLGRGGSDLTATVLGAAAPVDEIQVWKDVDGIMTTDPRLVKAAQPVSAVTYEEAAELAYFGAGNILWVLFCCFSLHYTN